MSYGDIPETVKQRLASEEMRTYHAVWHAVRNEERWLDYPDEVRIDLIQQGWEPPRFERQDMAGIDFLYMHRQMIHMVNNWASTGNGGGHAHHTKQQFVKGWLDIPWEHTDEVWPMPTVDLTSIRNQELFGSTKAPETTALLKGLCDDRFCNRSWLRTVSLDKFGTDLEISIHGWFHMHWSSEPPAQSNSLDTDNDWLGSPFSSHVNKHFWKLHGWIDNRITAWADANGEDPDLSGGWDGPTNSITGDMHSADPELFKLMNFKNLAPLLMPWDGLLLE